jgi:CheY-like chemotaxis protein
MDTEITNNGKILLVEDDLQDVKMTVAALKECHLANEITVVRDGAEALDYLYRRGKFQTRSGGDPILVLLDNKMPKVTGLQVLKTIKADEHLKMIPVVALTSSRLMPDLIEFYKHGVNAYVVKPVGFPEFVTAIKLLGVFWMTVNEPPPVALRKGTGVQNGGLTSPGKEEAANETDAILHSQKGFSSLIPAR